MQILRTRLEKTGVKLRKLAQLVLFQPLNCAIFGVIVMENSESRLKFTETENKIRKTWLFLSTILPATVLVFFIIVSIFVAFTSSNFMEILMILLFSLVLAGGFYMNYYCAYKNPGTILLLLMMIGISLNLLTTFFKPENLALMSLSLVFLLFMLVILVFKITVFYYSYKLRKINKKMKERKLTATPMYINALSVFSTATTLEELNVQFSKLRTSDNSGSAVQALALAYEQQKKMICCKEGALILKDSPINKE